MIDEIAGIAPHEVAALAFGEKPFVLDDFFSHCGGCSCGFVEAQAVR